MSSAPPVLPSVEDPFVRATSAIIGGPPGRHARLHEPRFWIPIRLLVLFAVIGGTLGWMEKSSCATHGYVHEYQYSRLCYTDVLALWYDEGLQQGKIPILDNETPQPGVNGLVSSKYVEYPVLIGALMAAAEGPVHLIVGPTAAERRAIVAGQAPGASQSVLDAASAATSAFQTRQARIFFDLTAFYLLLCAVAVVVLTGLTAGRRRIWDAAMVGLCPVLVLHADVNWDLAAVAFTSAALFAWSRRRPGLAGVLLGLGVATKFYPLLLLVPLLALCIRAGALRAYARTLGAAVLAWAVVDVPVWVANPAGFGRFYAFSEARGTEYNSLFYAWQYFVFGGNSFWDQRAQSHSRTIVTAHGPVTVAAPLPPTWLNFWSGLLLGLALLSVFAFILLARRRPRLGQVAFLTVLAFVLTNKVYSPQYALWLLPLVVLARPRWRYFLIWQATEVVLLITLYAHLIFVDQNGGRGISYPWFFAFGLVPRDLVLLGLAGLVVHEINHPEADVVRTDGVDDPAGGVLDGSPDRLILVVGDRPGDGYSPVGDLLTEPARVIMDG